MVQAFRFDGRGVTHRARVLARPKLSRETEAGRRLYWGFGTAIDGGSPVRRLDERRSHIGGHKRSAAAEDRVHPICYPDNGGVPLAEQYPANPVREFARAGLAVCRRAEVPSVDLERFEPMSDHLAFELRPLAPLPGEVTLLIKACAMETATLDVQVPHLVSQLEGPRAFAERILVIDSREDGFLRQHTRGSPSILRDVANHLVETGWIDRIVEEPGDGDAAAALHRRWFGFPAPRAHAATGAQLASTLAGFEACRTRYVLHAEVRSTRAMVSA